MVGKDNVLHPITSHSILQNILWSQSMQKYQKLRRSSEFDFVKRHGDGVSDSNIVMLAMNRNAVEESGESRLGFVVSKKIGGAAVRNKYKRRLRESAASIPIVNGMDIVFIAKQGILKSDFKQISSSVHKLLGNANLISIE